MKSPAGGPSEHPLRTVWRRPCSVALAVLLALPPALSAQDFRGWVGTTVQAVELRPLGLDTVPRSELEQDASGRFTYQGRRVTCPLEDLCTTYAPAAEDVTFAATQDVGLTAWGFGVQGLSFTTLLRGRARAGGDLVWPRSDDEFDALVAYVQLRRGPIRIRLGRQEIRSGLGFPAFDGASVAASRGSFELELYGGRSLARGFREPTNQVISALEDFVIDESARLFGASARVRLLSTALTARYQREILSDRSSLLSERASFDFVSILPTARITGSLDYDFGFQRVGKSHLTVAVPAAEGKLLVEASGRRYVPYFDLSTIWGFFEPVAYSELELRTGWSPTRTLGVWVSGGYRTYEDAGATVILEPLTDDGWRAGAGVHYQWSPRWSLDGRYDLEWGPGGFLNSGDVTARFAPSERLSVGLSASTFQQIEEFLVGEGRAFGAGASFDLAVTDRISLAGGASILRHRDGGTARRSPWNQSRGWTSLRIGIGGDPGLENRRDR